MKIIPKKSLGQHFLRSDGALNKIIAAAELTKKDIVVEVGPGEGVLTEKLLQVSRMTLAIEKDSRSIEFLNEKFKKEIKSGKLVLIEGDILETDFCVILAQARIQFINSTDMDPRLRKDDNTKYRVVANIPYYISGALIRFFLESKKPPTSMTLLLQKEVVERIVAKDKKESILSISVKAYGEVSNKGIVKAGSFFPPPKVDSAILHVSNVSKDFFKKNKIEEERFFEVLKAGFAHKRKLISNNLKEKSLIYPKNFPLNIRPEDLNLKDWAKITKTNNINK
jgi:16S rRNA (adenine1518-N6/adenine1519-N6)-dimethyltransferase